MPFTVITPPVVGDGTRLDTFAVPVINDLNYLNGILQIVKGQGIINGSFELDTAPNSNLAPIEWSLALAAGNSCGIATTAADVVNGAQSFFGTNPGAVSGGVVITTADFYPIGELDQLNFFWWMMSTIATVTNQVYVIFYKNDQTLLSTTTLYNAATGNPTAWTRMGAGVQAPTTARFFKLQFSLVDSTTAGTTWIDGINYSITSQPKFMTFVASTTQKPSPTVTMWKIRALGPGGGGGGGSGAPDSSWVGTNTLSASGAAGPSPPADGVGSNYIDYGAQASGTPIPSAGIYGTGGAGSPSGASGQWVEYYLPVSGNVAYTVHCGTGQAGSGGGSPGAGGMVIIEELFG